MGNIFDIEKINKRMAELEKEPTRRIYPFKDEPRFSVTQLFETNVEVTLYFVIRNGEMLFYDSKTEKKI